MYVIVPYISASLFVSSTDTFVEYIYESYNLFADGLQK